MRKIIVAAVLMASPAFAQQQQCGPVVDLRAWLIEEYGESIAFAGIINEQATAELWLADASWTVLMVRADGIACLGLSGGDWQSIPSPIPGIPG